MNFNAQFDYIVSFWCLQWTSDIKKAFVNMLSALKPGGKIFTLFPAGDDPFIMSYYALKDSGQIEALNQFKAPMEYGQLANLAQKLEHVSCKELKVELCKQSITLPSLDVFRKFVNGIAFYQGQIADAEIKHINEAMVQYYDQQCQQKYQGEYQFNFTIYLVTGEK
jgi:SAM-dependent methyltransferase